MYAELLRCLGITPPGRRYASSQFLIPFVQGIDVVLHTMNFSKNWRHSGAYTLQGTSGLSTVEGSTGGYDIYLTHNGQFHQGRRCYEFDFSFFLGDFDLGLRCDPPEPRHAV